MEGLKITVENKCEEGKRKIVVYNSSNHEYSFIPNKGEMGTVTVKEYNIPPVYPPDRENYLMIAPAPGPGNSVGPCKIDLPLNSGSSITIIQSGIENMTMVASGSNTSLTIPLSPPTWQLKIAGTSLLSDPRGPVSSEHGSHGQTTSDLTETTEKTTGKPKT